MDREEVEKKELMEGRRLEPGRRVAAAWKVPGSLAKLCLDTKLPNISEMSDVHSQPMCLFTFQIPVSDWQSPNQPN